MEHKEICAYKAYCRSHRREMLGVVFLVIATILTVINQSSLGILGMFLAGLALCACHRHKSCCCNECNCCDDEKSSECSSTEMHKKAKPKKVTEKS